MAVEDEAQSWLDRPAGDLSDAAPDTVEDIRAHAVQMHGLVNMAARLGVTFDAQAAIRKGTSLAAARRAVLDAAAEADEKRETITGYAPTPHDPAPSSAAAGERTRAAFRRGLTGGGPSRASQTPDPNRIDPAARPRRK